jgi:hypothetical protein
LPRHVLFLFCICNFSRAVWGINKILLRWGTPPPRRPSKKNVVYQAPC